MATSENVLTSVLESRPDSVITVTVERYNELVRKEALLDAIMVDKDISVYLYTRLATVESMTGGVNNA